MSPSAPIQPLPPDDMLSMFGGAAAFLKSGREWLRYFQDACRLQPREHVLDIGCGVGRLALPLATYLSPDGSYHGLDIVPERIQWCSENITPRWPICRFHLANIFNRASNPSSENPAAAYVLPYDNDHFDFVFLISVFTHMLPADVQNYLREIARVLKPGGRTLATYLILNANSVHQMQAGETAHRLDHDFGSYRVADRSVPERLIGYREDFLLQLYRASGLEVQPPIRYGRWSNPNHVDARPFMLQDVVLAHRPSCTTQLRV